MPAACTELGNSTAVIKAAVPDFSPGASYTYRFCTPGEPTSDVCDPGPAQVRSNTLAFLVVFGVQILALVVSKFVIMWKLRGMVAKNNRDRRRAMMLDATALRHVDAFIQREEDLSSGVLAIQT